MTTAVQHAATAARLREEADLVELIAGVIFDAVNLIDAGDRLRSVADAKRSSAALLDEMADEQQPAANCVCCTYDCGDRRGHVLNTDRPDERSCICGNYWPCDRPVQP